MSCKHPLSTHSRVSYRILSLGGEQDGSRMIVVCKDIVGAYEPLYGAHIKDACRTVYLNFNPLST